MLKERHGIDMSVDLFGDGALRPALEDLARHKNLQLRFYGFVQDPAECVAGSEIVFAGGYLSIIEALSLGKPVFALYRDPVRRDYLSCFPRRDLVCIAKSADELADKIAMFYRETTTPPVLRAAARQAASQFSWESVAREYVKLYRSAHNKILT